MSYLQNVKNFLSGRKTYITAFLMVLVSVVNYVTGDISLTEFVSSGEVELLLQGLGLGFVRAGIAKVE